MKVKVNQRLSCRSELDLQNTLVHNKQDIAGDKCELVRKVHMADLHGDVMRQRASADDHQSITQ